MLGCMDTCQVVHSDTLVSCRGFRNALGYIDSSLQLFFSDGRAFEVRCHGAPK